VNNSQPLMFYYIQMIANLFLNCQLVIPR
jgi:hypothetical protein